MSSLTQENRPVKINTALPEDTLVIASLSGAERLSALFEYNLGLVSEDHTLDLDALMGTEITVEFNDPEHSGAPRYFHGFVSDSSYLGEENNLARYEISIRPWMWFLTRTTDCKIFQNMSVPDIIQMVLGDEGFTDIDNKLFSSYEPWNYCVQYRETDFNFVSRLMEQEGIYYYFKHDMNVHTMVLCDSYSAHEAAEGYETVPYFPPDNKDRRTRDHISDWNFKKSVQPGSYVTRDFNFETPKADMEVKNRAPGPHTHSEYEVYDYPGEYPDRSSGETYVRQRMEAVQAQYEQASAHGNASGLATGNLFSLENFHREEQNREYLVVDCQCSIAANSFGGGDDNSVAFSCSILVIPSSQQYRAPRNTPKPIVQGPQTAIVVGPAGEEIWTDEHGRVKVQFHWDRYGESDENSSCWMRVSQITAGAGWGAIHIPRIGHEVIVECLDGDPDRPIITGCVYNGDNKPPNGLPGAGMVSGMKSNSTPGGQGYNQITLDDSKGEESMDVHAQFNRNSTVQNDDTLTVNNSRFVTVKTDLETNITEGNCVHDVNAGTFYQHVQGAVTEEYDASQDTTVAQDISITSSGGKIHVKAATSIKLETGASSIEMDAAGNISIKGINVAIEGAATVTIGGAQVTSEAKAMHQIKGTIVSSVGAAQNIIKGGVLLLNP